MAMRLPQTVLRGLKESASRDIFSRSRLLNYRNMSSRSSRKKKQGGKSGSGLGEFIEIKVSEGSVLDEEVKRLEDAIYAFMVRQAAPAWLPFRPGFSYWVPPRKSTPAAAASTNITDLIGRIVHPMTEEESLSLTTARGWPSYVYYVEGGLVSTKGLIIGNLVYENLVERCGDSYRSYEFSGGKPSPNLQSLMKKRDDMSLDNY